MDTAAIKDAIALFAHIRARKQIHRLRIPNAPAVAEDGLQLIEKITLDMSAIFCFVNPFS